MSLLTDYIKVYEQVLDADFCRKIIDTFNASNIYEGSINTEKGPGNKAIRSCLELNVTKERFTPEWVDIHNELISKFGQVISKYCTDVPGAMVPAQFNYEHFRMKKYRAGTDDHFSPHVDAATLESGKRFLVCFFYLNDVDDGGDTIFPHPHLGVKPRVGRALVFPPFWMYPHAALPAVSNDKYIIGTYLHYA